MDFDLCRASCEQCEGIDVIVLVKSKLYLCKHTEKLLERADDTTLKEL